LENDIPYVEREREHWQAVPGPRSEQWPLRVGWSQAGETVRAGMSRGGASRVDFSPSSLKRFRGAPKCLS
jgi:hypothetical protein